MLIYQDKNKSIRTTTIVMSKNQDKNKSECQKFSIKINHNDRDREDERLRRHDIMMTRDQAVYSS